MPLKGFLPSFAGGVLGAGLHGRVDLAKYDIGLRQGKNIFIHTHGGFSNRSGFEYVGDVDDSTKFHRLVPFERDDEANYALCFGDATMQPIKDGAFITSGGPRLTVASPYSTAQLDGLDYEQSIDVMYTAHRDVSQRKLSRASETSWAFSPMTFNPTNASPTAVVVTPHTAGTEEYSYTITAVDENGRESFAATATSNALCELLNLAGAYNTVTWTASAGADYYRVYRERGGVHGYIGFSEGLTFKDDNFSPDVSASVPVACTLFGAVDEYPSKVALAGQRLVYGGSNNDPEGVWGSRVGDYENFTRSKITRADEQFKANLSGRSINSVRGLLALRDLIAFGARGEFTVGAGGVVSATSTQVTQYGYTGSIDLKPIVVNDTALFVERSGDVVRDLKYAFEQDGYTGNELTILAYHFFDGKKIVDWTYAQRPYSMVWVVMDDGTLLSMTYKKEHQVWAWTEHELSGIVETVCTVNEDGYDAVYIVVRKTINGTEKRMVLRLRERVSDLAEDAFFVDYGVTYDGAPATVITGLGHLEGETAVALADGDVVEGLTVTGGQVTLPDAASKVHVGLFHRAYAETLPPAADLKGVGSSRGRPINVNEIGVQVENTRGIKMGQQITDLQEYIQVSGPDLSSSIEPETGFLDVVVTADWVKDGGTIFVVQDYPLPMTILAIAPEITVGY